MKQRKHVAGWVAAVVLPMIVLLTAAVKADPGASKRVWLPLVSGGTGGAGSGCEVAKDAFGTLSVQGAPYSGEAQTDPDFNLAYRGYAPTTVALKLVNLGPVVDPKAPQLPGLFGDRRTPRFSAAYQRYRWDEGCDCPVDTYSPWDATVLGLAVRPGEVIRTPDAGYDIGGGYAYQVLYAGATGITLYIGRDDDFHGYVVHVEDVCVDADLLRLYRKLHAAGRKELPALRAHEPFGTAVGGEIKVAVRDTGHFLDPRARNDWWQGR